MSFAYLPLFTGDYLRDTRHLTPLRHGVYLLLLMHCWDSKGPVPLDEQEAAGIANCRSADEVDALRYVLERFFVRMDDGWYNARMQQEVERSEALSNKRAKAGAKGYLAKVKSMKRKEVQAIAKQVSGNCQASASIPIPIPIPIPKESTSLSGKPDHIPLAKQILQFLNDKTGRNFQPVKANTQLIVARLREGYTEQTLRMVIAKKVRDWGADEKMMEFLRPKTLFTAQNFANYAGEVGNATVS